MASHFVANYSKNAKVLHAGRTGSNERRSAGKQCCQLVYDILILKFLEYFQSASYMHFSFDAKFGIYLVYFCQRFLLRF